MPYYQKAIRRLRKRGQNKLIKEAHLALRALRKVVPVKEPERLARAIQRLESIELSLIQGKYTKGGELPNVQMGFSSENQEGH
jgi:hypothetical protein